MNSLIVNSVKKFLEESSLTNDVYSYFKFYEKLRDLKRVQNIYEELHHWLEKSYKVKCLKILVFCADDNQKETLYQNASDTEYCDTSLLHSFVIEMNSKLKITFILMCNNKKHFKEIAKKEEYLTTLFYMISPLISSVSYQELVEDVSFKDTLTDSYNRKFLVEHLQKLLPLAKRETKHVAFLMVGMDHYKAIIDEFDYTIADKVLINLANILRENVRESDLVVRLERDEFLVVLSSMTAPSDAELVAQKLIDTFAKSEVVVNQLGHVLRKTICVGITQYDYEINSMDEILKNADISLYEARNLGRSKYKVYKPEAEECVELF
ncbi:MAG: GGDEF domain-containing protein [Candidatus Marinarcus sp.]|uniref:GGDEF domain-containing protein n=1 Tax=Candidatus Marinarcus sp. TaxID=3100987 RepID=UPI003B006868